MISRPTGYRPARCSFSANHTTSFFSGLGSGAYSAKLFAGTRHRFSGFNQARRRGDDHHRVLEELVNEEAAHRDGLNYYDDMLDRTVHPYNGRKLCA
jgi:hypothetical protein